MKTKRAFNGLSASSLKYIAIAAMLVDHIAVVFIADSFTPAGVIMRFIGRLTAPIMCYFVAEGYHKTSNVNRYTARLAIFAVLSYLPFIYMQTGALPTRHNFLEFNVIYTLLLGLLALRASHEIKRWPLMWGAFVVILVLSLLGDWKYIAVLMVVLFDWQRHNPRRRNTFLLAYAGLAILNMLPGLPFLYYSWRRAFVYIVIQAGVLVPLFLLPLYNGKRGRGNKWFFYFFYPVHMVLVRLAYVAINTWL